MKRRIFKLGALLSSVLCVATVVLWVRSCGVRDRIIWEREDGSILRVYSDWGRIDLLIDAGPSVMNVHIQPPGTYYDTHQHERGVNPDSGDWTGLFKGFLGFEWEHNAGARGSTYGVVIPLWFCVAVLGAAAFYLRRRAKPGNTLGVCSTCSYNLAGNTSGVCPECGTAVAGKVERVA